MNHRALVSNRIPIGLAALLLVSARSSREYRRWYVPLDSTPRKEK